MDGVGLGFVTDEVVTVTYDGISASGPPPPQSLPSSTTTVSVSPSTVSFGVQVTYSAIVTAVDGL